MSRDAIYQAIVTNSDLNALGVNQDRVFPNYAADHRPTDSGVFLILRWEAQPFLGASRLGGFGSGTGMGRGARDLTIWAHLPREESSDYTRLDDVLDIIDGAIIDLVHVPGEDGYTLTLVRPTGRSADLTDAGFDTITRNAGYKVLTRRTA